MPRRDLDNPEELSKCGEFHVSRAAPGINRSGLRVGGSTYYVCCWISHFGHNLINMVVPSFHALSRIGREPYFDSINFLIDTRDDGTPRGNCKMGKKVFQVFGFVSGHPDHVLSLDKLATESLRRGYTHVCFDELIVGMLCDSLLIGRGKDGTYQPQGSHVVPGMVEPLRRQVMRTRGTLDTETGASSKRKCEATFLTRREGRGRNVLNFDTILDLARQSLSRKSWAVSSVSFDGLSLAEQYGIIRQTSLFVSVSGTGSHWAMFLHEGAVSIVIESRGYDVNMGLCTVVPSVYCLTVKSASQTSKGKSDISVEYEDMKRALQAASQRLHHSQCR